MGLFFCCIFVMNLKTSIMITKEDLLKRVDIIENNTQLTEKLRNKYVTSFEMIRVGVKTNLIKKTAVNFIKKLTKDLN